MEVLRELRGYPSSVTLRREKIVNKQNYPVAKKRVVTTDSEAGARLRATEIERMLKDAASELLKSQPSELKRLGIDEIALIN